MRYPCQTAEEAADYAGTGKEIYEAVWKADGIRSDITNGVVRNLAKKYKSIRKSWRYGWKGISY